MCIRDRVTGTHGSKCTLQGARRDRLRCFIAPLFSPPDRTVRVGHGRYDDRVNALRIERTGRDGVVARVTLARPDVHNAFDASLIAELRAAFAGFARED